MKINSDNGIISIIKFSPFDGTETDNNQRNDLIECSIAQSNVTPENRLDVFDETFLVFSDSYQAMDFLVTATSLSQQNSFQLALRTGLCCGEFFVHQNNIYGDAVNMSTQLSCSARENEILICSANCKEVESYVNHHENLSSYLRAPNTISISLLDEDMTKTNSSKSVLQVTQAGFSKSFNVTRHKMISIGRSDECDITIDSELISRMHATLTLNFDEITIDDHSSNGTYLYIDNREIFLMGDSMKLPPEGEIYFGGNKKNKKHPETHIFYTLSDSLTSTLL